jgi:ABC-type transport system involved in multi-copper enzyme maturation permease subunit
MSAVTQQPTTSPEPGSIRRKGSLLRSEMHRFRSRRFIQVLLGLAVLGWLAATGIALLDYGEPTRADYAVAQQRMEQFREQEAQFREQCARDAEDAGQSEERFCGPPLDESTWRVEDFLDTAPFDVAVAGQSGAMAFAAAAAVLAFLIGATWIGAEWSTRSIVALLFWVPNRLKVVGTKLGVLALAATLLGVVAQLSWLLMAWILQSLVGADREPPAGFWPDLLAEQGRSVVLTVLVGLLGFGLANLIRNTGAALGIGFVYFAIVENALRIVAPMSDRWLLSTNAVALVLPGGTRIHDYSAVESELGEPPSFLVTNLHGGLVVTVFAAVVVGVGVVLFTRRDLH